MKNVNRRGSALLIVLGMLSFMLFSGLAFSLYMRQARLPSSFLRRSSVTRQIAKAALAEAMEEVDWAINNNPHPGVGDLVASRTYRGSQPAPRNYWYHRVYTGTNRVCNASETVPTLTLEGLAYLPPAFINEVRYFSRRTPTARWHRLRFDAGRYAYTAVDVSDCFDVNKLFADYPRSSAACRRVTFAHAFEQGYHDGPPNGAGTWDDWLENEVRARVDVDGAASFKNVMPFVSLADFNVAIRDRTFGNIKSPFVEYIANNGNGGQGFYQGVSDSATDAKSAAYGAMTFVTDSWNPNFELGKSLDSGKDISLASHQEVFFGKKGMVGRHMTFQEVFTRWNGSDFNKEFKFLPIVGGAALADYLDEDSVPCSLAIPTVERVPMVCGIKVNGLDGTLTVSKEKGEIKGDKQAGAGAKVKVSRVDTYRIDGRQLLNPGAIEALLAYPFRHLDQETPSGISVDGRLSLFFSTEGKGPRLITGKSGGALEFGLYDSNGKITFSSAGAIHVPLKAKTDITWQSADKDVPVGGKVNFTITPASELSQFLSSEKGSGKYLFTLTRQWEAKYITGEDGSEGHWDPEDPDDEDKGTYIECSEFAMPVLGATGLSKGNMLQSIKDGETLKLNAAVWIRVKKGKDVVDLAPATFDDDSESFAPAKLLFSQLSSGAALLKVDMMSEGGLSLKPSEIEKPVTIKVKEDRRVMMISDPRYNHDPECWYTVNSDLAIEKWFDQCGCKEERRDGDCYMATSDQGYLQSIYELAMLPRSYEAIYQVGLDYGGADAVYGGLQEPKKLDSLCVGSSDKNGGLMWKTYNPYPVNGRAADDFESLALVSGEGGVKVNPFSDSSHVLMAAFANTPHDWAVASTNRTMNPHWEDDAATFNAKYAWNTYSSDAKGKLDWSDLENLCDNFRAAVGDVNKISEWPDAFAGMWGADTSTKMLAGVPLQGQSSEIYSIDRKFLYGFWRESFEARQQLFLVFVRAEPMMMGGGVTGAAPPQLGTRAVALVWRDPREHKNNQSPHRMRVLFYHPLD